MDWSYSLFHVKAIRDDADDVVIAGLASTPEPDREGDIIEPSGISFQNPIPLLVHHDKRLPVGIVTLLPPTADGLRFEARIPRIKEPGSLKTRVDEVIHGLKYGIYWAVSIGYTALQSATSRLTSGGTRFGQIEVCELSLVTVPAGRQARVQTIKEFDTFRTASSPSLPGATGPVRNRATMTEQERTADQIKSFENTRLLKANRMAELMAHAGETSVTLDETQSAEYDTLESDVKQIDVHLQRLTNYEKQMALSAKPITTAIDTAVKPQSIIHVKSNVPPGTAFVRAACATLVCKGNKYEAAEYAKRWNDSTPEVALYLKAAIAPGTTTDAAWAGPLVNANIANDFIALLRPATILGKIPGLRTVPFNTKVPTQTAGGTYGWVGESKPKPVTKLAFGTTSLGYSKAAGIIVLTEELVRLSNPSAEALVRSDMIAGIAQFLDLQFIDPAVAAVAGVNPASITNGAPTAAATTNPLADILGLIQHFASNNISVDGVTFVMSAANALSLSFRTNLDGSPLFPGIGIDGGNYRGLTFVTSQAAGANVIALQPSLILYADDGQVSIDASREASLQMDSAPASPADATTVYVSLWQTNNVGLRAERWINWAKANTNAVKYLTAANYPSPAGTTMRAADTEFKEAK